MRNLEFTKYHFVWTLWIKIIYIYSNPSSMNVLNTSLGPVLVYIQNGFVARVRGGNNEAGMA